MTGLKTSVQLLGENKLWFNRKIAKNKLKCPTNLAHFRNRTNIVVCMLVSVIIAAVHHLLKLIDF